VSLKLPSIDMYSQLEESMRHLSEISPATTEVFRDSQAIMTDILS